MPGLHIPVIRNVIFSVGKAIGYRRRLHINEFPEEVLMNILLYVLRTTPGTPRITSVGDIPALSALTEETPVISLDFQYTPFPLSQVCQQWRKIVTTKSAFWSSIAVVEPTEKQLYRTQLWMERAGSQLLDIHIYQYSDPTEAKRAPLNAIFDLLCTRAHQWSTLFLKLDQYVPNRLLNNDLVLTNLHAVTLFLGTSIPVKYQESVWKRLHYSQRLRILTFSSTFRPSTPLACSLRDLTLTVPVSVEQLASQTRYYPNLKSLRVAICDNALSGVYAAPARLRTMGELQELCITRIHDADLIPFFEYFCLPSLASITVEDMCQLECDALWELIEESECLLRILSLGLSQGLSSDDILEWFDRDCLKNVETLVITGASLQITNDVLLQLHCPSRRGVKPLYFPKLKHLGLVKCHADINENDLISMLGSRYWVIPPLGSDLPTLKTELRTAVVVVEEKTHKMRMYEQMINQCAKTMMDFGKTKYVWRDRKLTIEQA